jgi:hypothetical protein
MIILIRVQEFWQIHACCKEDEQIQFRELNSKRKKNRMKKRWIFFLIFRSDSFRTEKCVLLKVIRKNESYILFSDHHCEKKKKKKKSPGFQW